MPFNLELLKEHPYATGGIVIVGGLIVFYLLSSSNSSSPATGAGDSNYAAGLAADAQLAQVQAGASVANNQTQAQLQQAELEAQVSNNQTSAAVQTNNVNTAAQLAAELGKIAGDVQINDSNNYANITEQANNAISQENIYGLQEAVLADQINAGVVENANNNATALAGSEYVADIQGHVALASLDDATKLATQSESDYAATLPYILSHAGDQKNSGLDATDQTAIFQTALSRGNPSVAAAGSSASASVAASGNAASAAKVSSVASGLSAVLQGLFGAA